MKKSNTFDRLSGYHKNIANGLIADAKKAGAFSNAIDKGTAREKIFYKFLKNNLPSKCSISFGGFLFDKNGDESDQIDIIIRDDVSPCHTFDEKSFGPVEGCLSVVSIKSMLDRQGLEGCLNNVASIPSVDTESFERHLNPAIYGHKLTGVDRDLYIDNEAKIKDGDYEWYRDWPYKIIAAYNGDSTETIIKNLEDFYDRSPQIPLSRRPNIIYIVGGSVIFRKVNGMDCMDKVGREGPCAAPLGTFFSPNKETVNPDIQAVSWILLQIQKNIDRVRYIAFDWSWIHDRALKAVYDNLK
jgi:hypothetical protein